jgi:hypothetical protein
MRLQGSYVAMIAETQTFWYCSFHSMAHVLPGRGRRNTASTCKLNHVAHSTSLGVR